MLNDKSDNNFYFIIRICLYGIGILLGFLLFFTSNAKAQETEEIFRKRISLPSQKTSIYNALNQLSDSTGYLFAYSSNDVLSDRTIRPNIKNIPLREALFQILGDTLFKFRIIEKHILIYKETTQKTISADENIEESKSRLAIKGRILDSKTRQPIIYATVGLPLFGIGTITNQDGTFYLKIPSELLNNHIIISHIGYESKEMSVAILSQQTVDIFLETNYISIQEVFIRNIEPQFLVKEAVLRIPTNFNANPAYLTAFYREGVVKDNKYQNYSEAIFSIYKTSYSNNYETDQVKLLKSRKIHNIEQTDTISIKLRGGVNSALLLDISKNLPDFFDIETINYFNFSRKDIVTIGNRTAYEIAFEQKPHIAEALLKGVVYIDMENLAILGADFEINPKFISSVADMFLLKRNRKFIIKPERVYYSVRYSKVNESYNLSHVRGDLHFKYRKRKSIFYSPFHTFIELVVTQIETQNVKRFDRHEIEKTTTVFTDNNYEFDEQFWGDFNIITPEQSIFDALNQINSKIEQISIKKENNNPNQ
jgi:hypothetical protein